MKVDSIKTRNKNNRKKRKYFIKSKGKIQKSKINVKSINYILLDFSLITPAPSMFEISLASFTSNCKLFKLHISL